LPGGHLTQLPLITRLIRPKILITYDDRRDFTVSNEFLRRIFFLQTRFNVLKHSFNFLLFFILVIRYRPIALISTGGGPFVLPLFLAAKVCGLRTMYVDTLLRVTEVSGTCSLINKLRLSDQVLFHWPGLTATNKGIAFRGSLFDLSNGRNSQLAICSATEVLQQSGAQ
jgi:hypothetical protein